MDAALKRRLEELGDDECANPVKRQRLDTFENISGVGDAADMMNVNLTLNDLGFDDKVLATIAHDDIDSDMVDVDVYLNFDGLEN